MARISRLVAFAVAALGAAAGAGEIRVVDQHVSFPQRNHNLAVYESVGRASRDGHRLLRIRWEELKDERKETVAVIDTRREGDPAGLQLSNFHVHEDAGTGRLILRMTR